MGKMKILMLVNWKVDYCEKEPEDKQPPDYYIRGEAYWFYKYFHNEVEVDVEDIHTFPWLERFEKEKLRFYIMQTLRVFLKLNKYDLIVSHGMQSGVTLSLFRRLFYTRAKHIVFEIGSFNSAAERGAALKLMQFASKSIDGIIYHTEKQMDYYKRFFPWITAKSRYIPYGADAVFFNKTDKAETKAEKYILCVGYSKRDWNTLCCAFDKISDKYDVFLRLVGKEEVGYHHPKIKGLSYMPVKELMKQIEGAMFCIVPLENFNYSFGQMTLLQQMALEKAVIAAKVPSMEGYIKDGENALFYESGNAIDLAQKMELLLKDDGFRNKLERNAGRAIRDNYNEKNMARKIERFYEDVLRGSYKR